MLKERRAYGDTVLVGDGERDAVRDKLGDRDALRVTALVADCDCDWLAP